MGLNDIKYFLGQVFLISDIFYHLVLQMYAKRYFKVCRSFAYYVLDIYRNLLRPPTWMIYSRLLTALPVLLLPLTVFFPHADARVNLKRPKSPAMLLLWLPSALWILFYISIDLVPTSLHGILISYYASNLFVPLPNTSFLPFHLLSAWNVLPHLYLASPSSAHVTPSLPICLE